MSKFTCALAALLISSHGFSFAEDLDDVVLADDICKSRPELCEEVEVDDDGNPIEAAPKKAAVKKPIAKPVAKNAAPVAKRALTSQAPKRRCRVRGQNYSLADADMPYCAMTPAQQKAAAIAAREKANGSKKPKALSDEERFEALYEKDQVAVPAKPAVRAAAKSALPERKPAAAVIAKPAAVPAEPSGPAVTFDSYLKSNSVHPALAMKINNRQSAFVEVQRPAVIGIQLKDEPEAPAPSVMGTPVPSMEKPGPVAPPPQGY